MTEQEFILNINNIKKEWDNGRDTRISILNDAIDTISKLNNKSIIDKLVCSPYTNINSSHGPTMPLDIFDYFYIASIFPNAAITNAKKFIYTTTMDSERNEALSKRQKRKLGTFDNIIN